MDSWCEIPDVYFGYKSAHAAEKDNTVEGLT